MRARRCPAAVFASVRSLCDPATSGRVLLLPWACDSPTVLFLLSYRTLTPLHPAPVILLSRCSPACLTHVHAYPIPHTCMPHPTCTLTYTYGRVLLKHMCMEGRRGGGRAPRACPSARRRLPDAGAHRLSTGTTSRGVHRCHPATAAPDWRHRASGRVAGTGHEPWEGPPGEAQASSHLLRSRLRSQQRSKERPWVQRSSQDVARGPRDVCGPALAAAGASSGKLEAMAGLARAKKAHGGSCRAAAQPATPFPAATALCNKLVACVCRPRCVTQCRRQGGMPACKRCTAAWPREQTSSRLTALGTPPFTGRPGRTQTLQLCTP